jgi:preprotein translocase subunit SecE
MGNWISNIQTKFRKAIVFFKDSWQELKRVHWPTRKETYAATSVVLVLVLIIALYLALVDLGLTRAVKALLS